jgi:uncharacterized protein (TIGR03085 family)
MTSVAQYERAALADLLDQVGPDQPTLCSGWVTRDLAAHLVMRERRPDAAVGIALAPLAGHAKSVMAQYAAKPWPELVDLVRHRSPLLVGPLDDALNSAEFFVHHEDVRRAQEGWQPRPADVGTEQMMWRMLRSRGRAFFRRSPVGVVLTLPDGTTHVASNDSPSVTLVGPASELVLYAFGRTGHAHVEVKGDPDAVSAFSSTRLGV